MPVVKQIYTRDLHCCSYSSTDRRTRAKQFLHPASSTEGGFSSSTCVVVQLINGLTVTAVTHAKLALKRAVGFFVCIMTRGHNSESYHTF